MTSEELKAAAAVMLAASEGREIEYKPRNDSHFEWTGLAYSKAAKFDWSRNDYRVKPWTQKTLGQIAFEASLGGRWVKDYVTIDIEHENWEKIAAAVEAEVLRRQKICGDGNVVPVENLTGISEAHFHPGM